MSAIREWKSFGDFCNAGSTFTQNVLRKKGCVRKVVSTDNKATFTVFHQNPFNVPCERMNFVGSRDIVSTSHNNIPQLSHNRHMHHARKTRWLFKSL